jgi:hypothetical protein
VLYGNKCVEVSKGPAEQERGQSVLYVVVGMLVVVVVVGRLNQCEGQAGRGSAVKSAYVHYCM